MTIDIGKAALESIVKDGIVEIMKQFSCLGGVRAKTGLGLKELKRELRTIRRRS